MMYTCTSWRNVRPAIFSTVVNNHAAIISRFSREFSIRRWSMCHAWAVVLRVVDMQSEKAVTTKH